MKIIPVLTILIILLAGVCRADIFVVTHQDNPIRSLTKEQVRELYLARSHAFPDGEDARVFDRTEGVLRTRFIESVLDMRVRQFDAYWARLIFAGRVLPLDIADREDELLIRLKEDIHSIAYTDRLFESETIKTLLVVRE